jgi:hypothetical protein
MSPDRLNPNAVLVLLGSVMYAYVGGPVTIGGGFVIAVGLFAWRRHEEAHPDESGPTSLFGASDPTPAHIGLISSPPCFRLMPAVRVAIPSHRLC